MSPLTHGGLLFCLVPVADIRLVCKRMLSAYSTFNKERDKAFLMESNCSHNNSVHVRLVLVGSGGLRPQFERGRVVLR
jgi:hypothetical protein